MGWFRWMKAISRVLSEGLFKTRARFVGRTRARVQLVNGGRWRWNWFSLGAIATDCNMTSEVFSKKLVWSSFWMIWTLSSLLRPFIVYPLTIHKGFCHPKCDTLQQHISVLVISYQPIDLLIGVGAWETFTCLEWISYRSWSKIRLVPNSKFDPGTFRVKAEHWMTWWKVGQNLPGWVETPLDGPWRHDTLFSFNLLSFTALWYRIYGLEELLKHFQTMNFAWRSCLACRVNNFRQNWLNLCFSNVFNINRLTPASHHV